MTSLCIEYLKLPALCTQPIKDIDQYVSQGCYGFMDYAISNWVRHFEAAATRIGEDEASAEQMVELEESLEVFLDIHWAKPRKPAEVADRHRDKLRLYEQTEIYEKLVWAFGWARKLVKSHTSISAAETVLDLVTILVQVRQRIEEAWQKSEHDAVVRDRLQINYGNDIYKCPRPSCYHFNHGFIKKSSRDEHVEKHERSYRCNVEGCPSSVLGFTKQRDLQKHMDNTHDSYTVGDEGKHSFPKPGEKRKAAEPAAKPQQTATKGPDKQSHQQFPPSNAAQNVSMVDQMLENERDVTTVTPDGDSTTRRSPSPATPEPMPPLERPVFQKKVKGPTVYECSTCNKKYSKKSNYDSHMRIHSQEKPFSCAYCSKGFARVNDRKRHEAGHAATGYVCQACGKDFKRSDTLQNHFKSQMGRKCLESLQGMGQQGSA
jgi:DNA-directed RNA polymerase subunit RPC12/RpoP